MAKKEERNQGRAPVEGLPDGLCAASKLPTPYIYRRRWRKTQSLRLAQVSTLLFFDS